MPLTPGISFPHNQRTTAPPDRDHRTPDYEDVAEASESLPYRGDVDHGMPHPHPHVLDETDRVISDPFTTPEVEPPTPVPVIVVNRGTKELRSFRTTHVFVAPGDLGRQIINRHDTRTNLRITSLNGSTAGYVTLGGSPTQSYDMHGEQVKTNVWTSNTQMPVYASAPATNTAIVELTVYEEFTVQVP